MSVINDVLKDLEARESGFTPIDTGLLETSPRARKNRQPLILASSMLFALSLGAWLFLQPPPPRDIPLPLSADIAGAQSVAPAAPALADTQSAKIEPLPSAANDSLEPAPAAPANAAPAEANQIVGLQIRETEQEMRLQFAMREKVVAYLRERGENSFAYHLRDIESRITAPIISDNPWIQELAIEPGDSGVDIHFETAPDILVETRQNLVDGEAVWAISLRKAITPPAAVEDSAESAPVDATPPGSAAAATAKASASVDAEPTAVEQTPPLASAEVKLEIRTTSPDAPVANRLEYATRLLTSGRYADAENLLRELLGGVGDYRARRHLLAIYQSRQQRDRFERLAQESAQKYPQDSAFKTEYARALFQRQAYRAVIDLFAGHAALDANQQAMLAASYQRLDEHDNAIRHYRLALRQDGANAKNWIGLGISQEHSAELEAALDSYQRAGRIGRLNERLQAFVEQRSDTLRRVLN